MYKSVLFDIDNTLTEIQPTLDLMALKTGQAQITPEDVIDFRLSIAFGIPRQEELDFWANNEYELCDDSVLAVDRVQTMLDTYTDTNTVVHVITARQDKYFDHTLRWLERHGFQYDYLECLGKESKVEYMERHNIEAVFEDNPAFFYELQDSPIAHKVDSFVIDYAYNQDVPATYRLDVDTGEIMYNEQMVISQ